MAYRPLGLGRHDSWDNGIEGEFEYFHLKEKSFSRLCGDLLSI